MAHKKALIVGPFGVIGRNLVHYLSKQQDWDIVGLSRRSPDFASIGSHNR